MHEFYATQSPASDPGSYAYLFDGLPQDIGSIAQIVRGLVYHYMGHEHIYGFRPPQERLPEIDTRSTQAILERILELDDRPLTEPRDYDKRFIGCCRDFSLLTVAILRHQGRAARSRYGFASYFVKGYWFDHVVVEVWEEGRWRRFDPQIPVEAGLDFNVLDMPAAPFVTGGRAWQMVRAEGADPSDFGIGREVTDVSGVPFVRSRLQLDIAALNKQEMLCWDEWDAADDALLDQVVPLTLLADSTELCARVAAEPKLRVPETVTCFNPAARAEPVEVTGMW